MDTKFITKVEMQDSNGRVAKFKFITFSFVPIDVAISMAIDKIGLDDYLFFKYHLISYSTRRL